MANDVRLGEPVDAIPEAVGMSSARIQSVSRLVQGYVDQGRYAGAICVLARHGKIVHYGTYGSMDAEAGKPMVPDTIFRIASMTKPIVAVAFMTLYEEGYFQLDTPVAEFLPAFADVQVFARGDAKRYKVRAPSRPITICDLLTHTAGFEGLVATTPVGKLYQRAGIVALPATGTLADRAAALARMPLVGDPGAQFTYHYATDVVGRLCELISGKPLDTFLTERVLAPLGMRDTAFHVPAGKRDRFAACYDQTADGPVRFRRRPPETDAAYAEDATYQSAGGGLTSTADDYMRFAKMLAAGGTLVGERIIGSHTLRFMTLNHLPEGRELDALWAGGPGPTQIARGTGMGLGFAVLLNPARAQLLGTPGEYYWGGAYSTAFLVSPADDLVMLFLAQLAGSNYLIRRQLRVATYQAITD